MNSFFWNVKWLTFFVKKAMDIEFFECLCFVPKISFVKKFTSYGTKFFAVSSTAPRSGGLCPGGGQNPGKLSDRWTQTNKGRWLHLNSASVKVNASIKHRGIQRPPQSGLLRRSRPAGTLYFFDKKRRVKKKRVSMYFDLHSRK
jgi:hypothetical protein